MTEEKEKNEKEKNEKEKNFVCVRIQRELAEKAKNRIRRPLADGKVSCSFAVNQLLKKLLTQTNEDFESQVLKTLDEMSFSVE